MVTSKEKNFISCVIYLHNEENTAAGFLDKLCGVLKEYFEKYEIVCVNDGCMDQTVDRIKSFLAKEETSHVVSLINLSGYQGVEAAMNAGRDLAVGDFIFEFDNCVKDFEDSLIMEVYHKALEGYDVAAAAPKKGVPFTSWLFYKVYNWDSHSRGKLRQERFRIVSRRAVNRVNQLNNSIPYRKALYMNCGLKTYTIAYNNKVLAHKSRNREERGLRSVLAMDTIIIFTDILEKVSMLLSTVFLAVLLFISGYLIHSFFSPLHPVEGWLSIMALMSFGFFMLFVMLTLIFKYLAVILNMQFRRQQYVIEGVEKLTK